MSAEVGGESTNAFLFRLLTDEYGDEGWRELGSLRRIAKEVDRRLSVAWEQGYQAAWPPAREFYQGGDPLKPANPYGRPTDSGRDGTAT